jgi:hypothetical protein
MEASVLGERTKDEQNLTHSHQLLSTKMPSAPAVVSIGIPASPRIHLHSTTKVMRVVSSVYVAPRISLSRLKSLVQRL